MDNLLVSSQLARAAGAAHRLESIESFLSRLPASDLEWCVDAELDPAAEFRVLARPREDATTEETAPHPFVDELPGDGEPHALGLAFGDDEPPRLVWQRTADRAGGEQLAVAAVVLDPALAAPCMLLSDICNGADRCDQLSAEGAGKHRLRTTLSFTLPTADAAVRLLEHIGCEPTLRSNLFFKALLGVGETRTRPWPRVSAQRSVGDRPGWTVRYYAAGDPAPLADGALLDLIDAGPALLKAWFYLWLATPEPDRDRGLVREVGLELPDDAAADAVPGWSVFLGRR